MMSTPIAKVIVHDQHADTTVVLFDLPISQLTVQDRNPNTQVIDLHSVSTENGGKEHLSLASLVGPMYIVSQQQVPTNIDEKRKVIMDKYQLWYNGGDLQGTVYFEVSAPYHNHPDARLCVNFDAMQHIVYQLRERTIPTYPVRPPFSKMERSPVSRIQDDPVVEGTAPIEDTVIQDAPSVMLRMVDGTCLRMEHELEMDGRNELQVTAVFLSPPTPDAPYTGTIPSSEYILSSSMTDTLAGMAERVLSSSISFKDKVHLGHASLHFLRNQGGMLPRMVATVRKSSPLSPQLMGAKKSCTAVGCFPQQLHLGLNPIVTNANDRASGTMDPDTCSMAENTFEDQEHLKQSVVRVWHPTLGSAVAVRFHVLVHGSKGDVAVVNVTPDQPLWHVSLLRCKLSTDLRPPLKDDLDDIINTTKFPPRTDCYHNTQDGEERSQMIHALLEGPVHNETYATFVAREKTRLELEPCLNDQDQDTLSLKHALPFHVRMVVDGGRNATNGPCIAGQAVSFLQQKAYSYISFAGALKGYQIGGSHCLYDSATVDLQAQRYLSWEPIPIGGGSTVGGGSYTDQDKHYFCVAHTGLNALVDVLTMAETFGASPTTPTANLVQMPASEHQFHADVSFGLGNEKKRMPVFTGPLPLVRERIVTKKGERRTIRKKKVNVEVETVYFDDGSQLTLPANSPLVRTDELDGQTKYTPNVKEARNVSLRKTHCIGKPRHIKEMSGCGNVAEQMPDHITPSMVVEGTTTVLIENDMHLLKLIRQPFARSGPYQVTLEAPGNASSVVFMGDRLCDELPQIKGMDEGNQWTNGIQPVIGYTKQPKKNSEGHHWVYPTYLEKGAKKSSSTGPPRKKQRRDITSYCTRV